ncbi:MAG: tetratricopeptide repeat protein, partial [Burkholderiales bacterium]|nr:tetratricopeptide repeat protein [Burkholderiales bacterium]
MEAPNTVPTPTSPSPDASACFAAAQRSHQAGQLSEARSWYLRVIARDAAHFRAHAMLGALYLQIQDYTAAAASLQASLTLDENQPSTLLNLGIALQCLDRLKEAETAIVQALSQKPDYIAAWFNLAQIQKAQGNTHAALISLQRLLSLQGPRPDVLAELGEIQLQAGDAHAACASFEQLLAMDDRLVRGHLGKALALERMGLMAAALTSYDQAITRDPNCVPAHYNRAVGLLALGHTELALQGFDRVLQLRPDTLDALHNSALALRQLKHRD